MGVRIIYRRSRGKYCPMMMTVSLMQMRLSLISPAEEVKLSQNYEFRRALMGRVMNLIS